MVSNRVKTIVT